MKSGLPPKILVIRKKKLSFRIISVVIDCNTIFSVYCLNYSIYACIHWVLILWVKYANELCILPKRPDCNFKQTIVHINYARG